ncbi:MAG: putative septum site-determining protein MinC [Geminicoccaceae bacterium]|nr:MAG: putative septum site-determining protein MinC [Geminicoccaceae bacterium]
MQTVLSLRLIAPGDPEFFALLRDKIAHNPDFFRDAPVVLDLAPVADATPIDLEAFTSELRRLRLVPVGVQNAGPAWQAAARSAGLAQLGPGGQPGTANPTTRPEPLRQRPTAPPRGAGLVIAEPVRGGQQVSCPDGDLTVLAPVGHGAELVAAGHIHVYGPLRGRAFAGANGDERAMIFCDQLEAELVSIAGIYLVSEDLDPRLRGKRVRVWCDGERLSIGPVP